MLPVKDGSTTRPRPCSDRESVERLQQAAGSGSLEVLWRLQDTRIKINARDAEGNTAFQNMVAHGNLPAATLLKKIGSKINLPDGFGTLPLVTAIKYRKPAIVTALLAWHADPGLVSTGGVTPLRCAAADGQDDTVRELLLAGADPNAADGEGKAALHVTRSCRVAMLLLDHGANIELEDKRGMTPLHVAIERGDVPLARLLKDESARLSANAAELLCSVVRSGSREMLDLVLGWNVDYLQKAIGLAHTLVDIAVCLGRADLRQALKSKGIYVGPQIWQLHAAIKAGHAATVSVLLDWDRPPKPAANTALFAPLSSLFVFQPSKPTVFKGKLEAALCFAVSHGHADIVDVLLKEDLDLDADDFATSPLLLAAQLGHACITLHLPRKFSLAKQPDVASILMAAMRNGSTELVTLLVGSIPSADIRNKCAPAALAAAAGDLYMIFPALTAGLKADSDEARELMHTAVEHDSVAVLIQLLEKGCKPLAELLALASKPIVIDMLQHAMGQEKPTHFKQQQDSQLLISAMEELLIQPDLSAQALHALFLKMGLRGTNHARFKKSYTDTCSAFDGSGLPKPTLLQRRLAFAMLFIEQKDVVPYTNQSEKHKLPDQRFNTLAKAARAQLGEAISSCRAFMKAWHDKQLMRLSSICISHTTMDFSSLSRLGDTTGLFNDVAGELAACWLVALQAASRATPIGCRLLELPAWLETNMPRHLGAEIRRRATATLNREPPDHSVYATVCALQAELIQDYARLLALPEETRSSNASGNG